MTPGFGTRTTLVQLRIARRAHIKDGVPWQLPVLKRQLCGGLLSHAGRASPRSHTAAQAASASSKLGQLPIFAACFALASGDAIDPNVMPTVATVLSGGLSGGKI